MCKSVPHTDAVSTAISTSVGPIVGTGTSRISMPGAAFALTRACIVRGSVLMAVLLGLAFWTQTLYRSASGREIAPLVLLISATQPRQRSAISLVRPAVRQPLPRRHCLALLGNLGPRRLALLRLHIEPLRLHRRPARISQPKHLYLEQPTLRRNRQLAAHMDHPRRFHRLTIAHHSPQFTRPCGQRPGLVEARGP